MAMKIANQYINMKLLRTMSFLRLAEIRELESCKLTFFR